ncbi:hypothetical protein BDV96DRAFT_87420 [Lophiotrema nucula]|uniref:Uncharacterized protein n=1 Tax=Lophiotrema nucula TaxID=690887 RepID=A0A6A5Z900_9PLEO|nr:hypothetical protein BDV96DRAFT_87420 [Lophiotrema nucula]
MIGLEPTLLLAAGLQLAAVHSAVIPRSSEPSAPTVTGNIFTVPHESEADIVSKYRLGWLTSVFDLTVGSTSPASSNALGPSTKLKPDQGNTWIISYAGPTSTPTTTPTSISVKTVFVAPSPRAALSDGTITVAGESATRTLITREPALHAESTSSAASTSTRIRETEATHDISYLPHDPLDVCVALAHREASVAKFRECVDERIGKVIQDKLYQEDFACHSPLWDLPGRPRICSVFLCRDLELFGHNEARVNKCYARSIAELTRYGKPATTSTSNPGHRHWEAFDLLCKGLPGICNHDEYRPILDHCSALLAIGADKEEVKKCVEEEMARTVTEMTVNEATLSEATHEESRLEKKQLADPVTYHGHWKPGYDPNCDLISHNDTGYWSCSFSHMILSDDATPGDWEDQMKYCRSTFVSRDDVLSECKYPLDYETSRTPDFPIGRPLFPDPGFPPSLAKREGQLATSAQEDEEWDPEHDSNCNFIPGKTPYFQCRYLLTALRSFGIWDELRYCDRFPDGWPGQLICSFPREWEPTTTPETPSLAKRESSDDNAGEMEKRQTVDVIGPCIKIVGNHCLQFEGPHESSWGE